jgi:hypothetical protein
VVKPKNGQPAGGETAPEPGVMLRPDSAEEMAAGRGAMAWTMQAFLEHVAALVRSFPSPAPRRRLG